MQSGNRLRLEPSRVDLSSRRSMLFMSWAKGRKVDRWKPSGATTGRLCLFVCMGMKVVKQASKHECHCTPAYQPMYVQLEPSLNVHDFGRRLGEAYRGRRDSELNDIGETLGRTQNRKYRLRLAPLRAKGGRGEDEKISPADQATRSYTETVLAYDPNETTPVSKNGSQPGGRDFHQQQQTSAPIRATTVVCNSGARRV